MPSNPVDFGAFISWAFYAIISAGIFYGVSILSHLKKSLDELNIEVVRLIEKTNFADTEKVEMKAQLIALTERVRTLELHRAQCDMENGRI